MYCHQFFISNNIDNQSDHSIFQLEFPNVLLSTDLTVSIIFGFSPISFIWLTSSTSRVLSHSSRQLSTSHIRESIEAQRSVQSRSLHADYLVRSTGSLLLQKLKKWIRVKNVSKNRLFLRFYCFWIIPHDFDFSTSLSDAWVTVRSTVTHIWVIRGSKFGKI